MTAENPLDPAVEARFKQLAACVSAEDWDKLIAATTERLLRRLAAAGLFDEATPEQLAQGHLLVGNALVDFTNVALTSVALGEARP